MNDDVRSFYEELCKWWRFDEGQQHTHSWHDREDFARDALPGLLDAALTAERAAHAETRQRYDELREGLVEIAWRTEQLTLFVEGIGKDAGDARAISNDLTALLRAHEQQGQQEQTP